MATIFFSTGENNYLELPKKWEGTASELFKNLVGHAKSVGISTRQKAWPKAPHVLVRQLNELTPSLKALGLEVATGVRTHSARRILINSTRSVRSDTEEMEKSDAAYASNACSSSSSTFLRAIQNLVSVHWIDKPLSEQECGICGSVRKTVYKAITNKDDQIWICEPCFHDFEACRTVG